MWILAIIIIGIIILNVKYNCKHDYKQIKKIELCINNKTTNTQTFGSIILLECRKCYKRKYISTNTLLEYLLQNQLNLWVKKEITTEILENSIK